MRRKYDSVFSLGWACSCTQMLRAAGLQQISFPLDWFGGGDITTRVDILTSRFDHWFELEDLVPDASYTSNTPHHHMRNTRNSLCSAHEFDLDKPLAETYPKVKERFDRRVARLLAVLDGSRTSLACFVDIPGRPLPSAETLSRCASRMREAWPDCDMELLYFSHVPDVAFADRKVSRPADHVTVVSFDYHYTGPRSTRYTADYDLLAKCLKGVRVRDYRTPAEKKAWREAGRKYRYDKFKARSWLDYALTRLQFKICRFLARRLTRKGVALDLGRGN